MRTPLLCAAIVGLLLFSGVGATGATVRTGSFSVAPISNELAARMTGVSWRPGCPVPLRDLRVVTASYRGFDGRAHSGRIVVHRDVARGVLTVLRRLYAAGFPIRRMVPVDAYGGSDFRSIEGFASRFRPPRRTGRDTSGAPTARVSSRAAAAATTRKTTAHPAASAAAEPNPSLATAKGTPAATTAAHAQ